MNKKKPSTKKKGLTDAQLIAKYEAPNEHFKKVVDKMLKAPAVKEEQKNSRRYAP